MEALLQDLRYGCRMMLKSPGFTAVALLSIALGIGANTSIFSVVNGLLLKPLPYKNPAQLMTLYQHDPKPKSGEGNLPWSYPAYTILRDQNNSFESVAAYGQREFDLTSANEPERVVGEIVSASYFHVLGVDPVIGRSFLPEEEIKPGATPVAMLGHDFWQRRFAADPSIVGRTISLDKNTLTVVGILPAGFRGQSGLADVWTPMAYIGLSNPRKLVNPFVLWANVIGKLKPGVSPTQGQAEMDLVAKKIVDVIAPPPRLAFFRDLGIREIPLRDAKLDPAIKKSFLVLLSAVGFVLLIACVNVANLLLGRSVTRRKELAIRLALGASRVRLIRQFLTESILLALLGALVGLFIALWGIDLLTAFKPQGGSELWSNYAKTLDFYKINLDWRVLSYNFLLALFTGVLFGLVPALQSSRTDVNEALKDNSGGGASLRNALRPSARSLLVVGEIALSLVLLIGAGLMIKSLSRLEGLKTGFDGRNVLTLKISQSTSGPGFYQQLLGRMAVLPGVESVSLATAVPLTSPSSVTNMSIEGRTDSSDSNLIIDTHSVSPDYFKTMRISLVRGRAFTNADRLGSPLVGIINETAARRYWPGEDPIGKRIVKLGLGIYNDPIEVIGIATDVKYGKVEEIADPDLYLSYLQPTDPPGYVLIRSAGDPTALAAAVRREVAALDKNVPLFDIKTMAERSAEATSRTSFSALLLGLFAGLALLLSAVGIYGVISYAVSARTREIGVRIALGAQRVDVFKLVVGQGLKLVLIGLGVGLVGAVAATRVMSSMLFGVSATDPTVFAAISILLGVVALLACYLPARRAMRVDPMVALRYE